MFIACNPEPVIKETETVDGVITEWQRDKRIIMVNPDHIVAIHKDYFEEGYHLVSILKGQAVASDLKVVSNYLLETYPMRSSITAKQ